MNKLILAIIAGTIAVVIGGILLSFSTYYNDTSYNYYTSQNCGQLYPPSYSNVSGYNYSKSYYTCEANQTNTTYSHQLYSSILAIPGWTLVFMGVITDIISIGLVLIAMYKDRNAAKVKK